MNADKRRRGDGTGALSEDERAELARLRKENAELAMERQSHLRGVLSAWDLEASAIPIVPVQKAPFAAARQNKHYLHS